MQQVWRKRWKSTVWIALSAITLVLLISAVYKKNHKVFKDIEVTFNGDGNNFFIEEKGVIALLKANGLMIGQPIEGIDLKAFEALLEKDRWIANAELFFDNNQVLQVIVEEKTPVARIFTAAGSSFYIDSMCRKLPLSEKLSARIPMFTNFPSDKLRLSKPDSELLASVKDLAMFIQDDDFWKAQVAQIDITPDGFEMIPTVGNHVVSLGTAGNWRQKFDRLFSFYKQVWTKVGFEKYGKIDVQFDGQVVATVKGVKSSGVDSGQVRKAYQKLLDQVRKSNELVINNEDSMRRDKAAQSQVARLVNRKIVQQVKARRLTSGNSAIPNRIKQRKGAVPVKQLAINNESNNKKVPKAIMKKPADFFR